MPDCSSRFTLVQLVAGDLDIQTQKSIREHLEGCHACTRVLEEIERNASEYEGSRLEQLGRLHRLMVEERKSITPFLTWGRMALAAGVAMMACLVVWAALRDRGDLGEKTDSGYKGALAVRVVAKRGDNQFVVQSGMTLQQGDRLRFILTTDAAGYVSIFSVNDSDKPCSFYPATDPNLDPKPWRIPQAGSTELPGSIKLDDWVGQEHFLVAFSEKPFLHNRLCDQARELILRSGVQSITASTLEGIQQLEIVSIQKAPGGAP